MIREMYKSDINEIAAIWLQANLQAHNFIEEEYWKSNYKTVKEMFLQAEIYVYEKTGKIQGFIGLDQEYIAGIFVASGERSKGVGKGLLDFVKDKKERLYLNVYQKNRRAINFYQREGFKIQNESVDSATEEKELVMLWSIENTKCFT